jgi:hypothetical protein
VTVLFSHQIDVASNCNRFERHVGITFFNCNADGRSVIRAASDRAGEVSTISVLSLLKLPSGSYVTTVGTASVTLTRTAASAGKPCTWS